LNGQTICRRNTPPLIDLLHAPYIDFQLQTPTMPFTAQHIKSARLHLQKSDPVMKRLLKTHGPFTAKARLDRFGTLVDSIISQQISTAAARTIKDRLKTAVSARTKSTNGSTKELSPEGLLTFDLDDLREIGVSRQKGTYLLDLALKVQEGVVDLKSLNRKSDEDVIQELIQVKGIGRWTAQMFLIFSLARLDVLAVDDLGLRNAVQRLYGFDELPNPEQMHSVAQPWRPYATVASWYLWRSLE
jgi:DNA-3-methyladenine glycosylase II